MIVDHTQMPKNYAILVGKIGGVIDNGTSISVLVDVAEKSYEKKWEEVRFPSKKASLIQKVCEVGGYITVIAVKSQKKINDSQTTRYYGLKFQTMRPSGNTTQLQSAPRQRNYAKPVAYEKDDIEIATQIVAPPPQEHNEIHKAMIEQNINELEGKVVSVVQDHNTISIDPLDMDIEGEEEGIDVISQIV